MHLLGKKFTWSLQLNTENEHGHDDQDENENKDNDTTQNQTVSLRHEPQEQDEEEEEYEEGTLPELFVTLIKPEESRFDEMLYWVNLLLPPTRAHTHQRA